MNSLEVAFFMDMELLTTHRQLGKKKKLKRLNSIKLAEASDNIDPQGAAGPSTQSLFTHAATIY